MTKVCAPQLRSWPIPYGNKLAAGTLKSCPDDFVVTEKLGFEASGEGEFDLLQVTKRSRNTNDVARDLARFAKVPLSAVSYAGLKDRHALTSQHFSVHLPGKPSPPWDKLDAEGTVVKSATRHRRKLRRGALLGNQFEIRIRDFEGSRDATSARFNHMVAQGMANYFGPQRFGRAGANLALASEMVNGARRPTRHLRGLLISALRAYFFNDVLGHRIAAETWRTCVDGDFMMLDASSAIFGPVAHDDEITRRLNNLEIHPTGPLIGAAGRDVVQQLSEFEQGCLEAHTDWIEALAKMKVRQDRRSLRTVIREPRLEWLPGDDPSQTDLWLGFGLDAGSYATVLLEQLGIETRSSHDASAA